jgi:hypothetical protein
MCSTTAMRSQRRRRCPSTTVRPRLSYRGVQRAPSPACVAACADPSSSSSPPCALRPDSAPLSPYSPRQYRSTFHILLPTSAAFPPSRTPSPHSRFLVRSTVLAAVPPQPQPFAIHRAAFATTSIFIPTLPFPWSLHPLIARNSFLGCTPSAKTLSAALPPGLVSGSTTTPHAARCRRSTSRFQIRAMGHSPGALSMRRCRFQGMFMRCIGPSNRSREGVHPPDLNFVTRIT